MAAKTGRFIWYDLMTKDVDGAKAFYQEVMGWNVVPFEGASEEANEPYLMWRVGEQPISGLLDLPEGAREMGAPSHWVPYIETGDVHTAVAQTRELGGTVYYESSVPEIGAFAILADPQGAVFAAFQPTESAENVNHKDPGFMGWHELNTTDYKAAFTFYEAIFGWEKTSEIDMGPEAGTYFMFKHPAREKNSDGGMFNQSKDDSPSPFWLTYLNVADLDAAVERVKRHKGSLQSGPMDVPGGRVAQCIDPQGAVFALHTENAN